MNKIILLFLFFLSSCAVQQKSVSLPEIKLKPEWVNEFKSEDDDFKYYVGIGISKNEKKSKNQAQSDAYEQAIKENFGVSIQASIKTYLSERKSSIVERSAEKTREARLIEFQKIDEYSENFKDEYQTWAFYKYPKAQVEKERLRLKEADLNKKAENKNFSIVGDNAALESGAVQIDSIPEGAVVYIDGARYGETPVKLIGVLAQGSHNLRLDHPRYEIVQAKFHIIPNHIERISKDLVASKGKIILATNPKKALIKLNQKTIGYSPMEITVNAYKNYTIQASHTETNPSTVQVQVGRNEKRAINIDLVRKTGLLSVYTFPEGADIFINKRKIGKSPLENIPISDEFAYVKIGKKGHKLLKKKIRINAGATKKIEFNLIPSKK